MNSENTTNEAATATEVTEGTTQNIVTLKDQIIADGKVDAEEVNTLRQVILADGKVDRTETDVLFEINDKTTEKHESFKTLFVESITNNILEDGVVDVEEANYLVTKIENDGKVDEIETALLVNIKEKATGEIPENLANLISKTA